MTPQGWHDRRVGLDGEGALVFTLGEPAKPPWTPPSAATGAVVEWSPELATFGRLVGDLVVATGGAALFVDYGRAAPEVGDTLQAIRGHARLSPLTEPGQADLTAHVDFPAFLEAARAAGAAATAIGSQAGFLRALGIERRADALARATPLKADLILRQLRRLVGPDQMGLAFKVACVYAPGVAEIPGLGTVA
jgi:SAM-dependent MidA family methyltransferase